MGRSRVAFVSLALVTACALTVNLDDLRGDGGSDAALDALDASPDVGMDVAPGSELFFFQHTDTVVDAGGGETSTIGVIQPIVANVQDGGLRLVGCPMPFVGAFVAGQPPYTGPAVSSREIVAAGEVKAFLYNDMSGSTQDPLLVLDDSTDCVTRFPLRIDPAAPADAGAMVHAFPRVSPDGTRVAYIDTDAFGTYQVGVVGIDGGAPRMLTPPFPPGSDAGVMIRPMPPTWYQDNSGTYLMWQQGPSPIGSAKTTLTLFQVPDPDDGGTPPIVTACSRFTQINQLELFKQGLSPLAVAVAQEQGTAQPKSDIWISSTLPCSDWINLTGLASGLQAQDVAVSPDGAELAYVASSSTTAGHVHLYVMAIVPPPGPFQPAVLCTTLDKSYDDIGPFWVAGGRTVAWTRVGVTGGVYVADVGSSGCTNVRPLLLDGTDAGVTTTGIAPASSTFVCGSNVAPGRAREGWAGLGALAVLAAVRRRRSRVSDVG